MKQKLLIIGIVMNSAGTEKSFLSFAESLDYDRFDVDLLLAKKQGDFMPLIPDKINVIELPYAGDMFLLSAKNAAQTIFKTLMLPKPYVAFEVLPYFIRLLFSRGVRRADIATELWCRLIKYLPSIDKEYDVAVAYWGDRTMFYMVDKVKAKKKITWLHFDYENPPRNDKVYSNYFEKCDSIVTVSSIIDDSLKNHFPALAERCVMIENINHTATIRSMAQNGESYTDGFSGIRLLTVGRISEQKGYDFAVDALGKLVSMGHDVRWYILGGGTKEDRDALIQRAEALSVADRLVFLGTTSNPYAYMKDCDIYVQPSRHEGRPIAVEEAKILAKPIVISNYLSAREQLGDGRFGIVCEISADGVAKAVDQMIRDTEKREEFVANLRSEELGNADEIEKFYKLL